MRKITVLLTAFLLVLPAASAAVEPMISIENISPQPADPGETVNVDVRLKNDGDTDATFDPLQVKTPEGVTVIGTTASFSDEISICGGCQAVGTVYLKVEKDATTGTYPLRFDLEREGIGVSKTVELQVDGSPNLLFSLSNVSVAPGETIDSTLSVTNVGTERATQVVANPDNDLISFQPSSVSLGSIPPGETSTAPITIEADSSMDSGIQKFSADIDYRTDGGEASITRTETLSIRQVAELAVSDVDTGSATIGKTSTLRLELENLGPGEAERIKTELTCDGATVNRETAFIGQLDDDESVPATFELVPDRKNVECTVDTSYRDDTGRNISETFTFSATDRRSPLMTAAIILAVIAGMVYLYWGRQGDEQAEI
ncbi:MAG: hypothetical protein MUP63_03530 [Candidatus Nanohaloarchaeota archaeon QJJ-7]|nr:hypothetical protein [Candidatus Nanohaloarchaeota archaeon QJJ-7]